MKILNFSFPALLTTYPYYFTLSAHEVRDAGKDKTGKPMSLKKIDSMIKFGFSEKVIKFEKIFVVPLTRESCSVRATAYLSKSVWLCG